VKKKRVRRRGKEENAGVREGRKSRETRGKMTEDFLGYLFRPGLRQQAVMRSYFLPKYHQL
jgi:hypothetical protein